MKFKSLVFIAALLGASPLAVAIEENYCVENPECNTDPTKCKCVDDKMGILFDDNGTAELTNVIVDQEFTIGVYVDVKNEGIQGWTFGIAHDPTYLDVLTVDIKGLIENIIQIIVDDQGNVIDKVATTFDDLGENIGFKIQREADAKTPGFIEAIILAPLGSDLRLELPVGDGYRVVNTKYKVLAVPPEEGTKLEFVEDRLPPGGANPTAVNLTIESNSKKPKKVENALVKPLVIEPCPEPDFAFYFGPEATSATHTITGNTVAISLRNTEAGDGFNLGIKKVGANLTFDNDLGKPVVEDMLSFLKHITQVPPPPDIEVAGTQLIGNSAAGAVADENITSVEEGAALLAIDGDYLEAKIAADGKSVKVVYVAGWEGNPDNVIPAISDTPPDCDEHEILIVTMGEGVPEVLFVRGDANGDRRTTITDGVLIAQNIFASRLIFFDCQDMLDVNDDGILNTADPVHLLRYAFLDGAPPEQPFPNCGVDSATPEPGAGLDCKVPNNCP